MTGYHRSAYFAVQSKPSNDAITESTMLHRRRIGKTRAERLTCMALHREEILYVPHVDHQSALIAWGAFYLEPRDPRGSDPAGTFRFTLLDDDEIKLDRPRGSIGRQTTPFGKARVRIGSGKPPVQWQPWRDIGDTTWTWIKGLAPDTRYHYEVEVEGRPWGEETLSIVMKDEDDGIGSRRIPSGPPSFRTFPAPDQPSGTFTFAVIGDPGTGDETQMRIGRALADRIDAERIRFVLTTGDNIYMKTRSSGFLGLLEKGYRTVTGRVRMSGDEDDDWFGSYFVPYRDVIGRVPVFPCLGNHDSENSEEDDDLAQLIDNLFLAERFPGEAARWGLGDDTLDTLFYRFRFGRDAEFVALDTSFSDRQDGFERVFKLTRGKRQPPLSSPAHLMFLDELLAGTPPRWRIPFGHHPPHCLGPRHRGNPMVLELARRFLDASPHPLIWLAGHEHNFQHHQEGRFHALVTGAAGKISKLLKKNVRATPASCCYSSAAHFLLVTVGEESVRVRLIDEEGRSAMLTPCGAGPRHDEEEITI